jgi:hypothetical protein
MSNPKNLNGKKMKSRLQTDISMKFNLDFFQAKNSIDENPKV